MLRLFIEIQIQAAYADGKLHPTQHRALLGITDPLGFSRSEFDRLVAMIGAEYRYRKAPDSGKSGMMLADAYSLLNIDRDASQPEVDRAYRRMLSRHHPDKLIARGLPEEMIKVANEKTHEIRAAYERIKAARKH
jgi:DnaJ like chaperone protein